MRKRMIVSRESDGSGRAVIADAMFFSSFVEEAKAYHPRGHEAVGVLLACAARADRERHPTEVHFFDPARLARDGAWLRVPPDEIARLEERLDTFKRYVVAPFHDRGVMLDVSPLLPTRWWLALSLRDLRTKSVQPFMDGAPIHLLVEGRPPELARVERLLAPPSPSVSARSASV